MSDADQNLRVLLEGCRKCNRNSQRRLYEHFYGYAMSICLRYTTNRGEALEVLNDAFLKVFTKIDQYDPAFPFKGWLRRVLIHTAIDQFRKSKPPRHEELSAALQLPDAEIPMPFLSPEEDVLPVLQALSPAYRVVFNLYVLEEYSHNEIAELLGITPGASRSNLTRACEKLRTLLASQNKKKVNSYEL
jgi:RNA polymerase sigma factor (sigma-70 family)